MVTKHGSHQSGSDKVGGDGRFCSASVVRSGRWIAARAAGARGPESSRAGWQHEASSRVEQDFRASCLFPNTSPSERVLVRSQKMEPVLLLTSPSSPLTRIESPLFRVLLQRRLRLPLPLSERICRCGLPWKVRLRGFAEKPVGASLQTCSCATWTTGAWRLSWMVCLFVAVHGS